MGTSNQGCLQDRFRAPGQPEATRREVAKEVGHVHVEGTGGSHRSVEPARLCESQDERGGRQSKV